MFKDQQWIRDAIHLLSGLDHKRLFSTVSSLVDYAAGEVLCPRCGSKEVEQCWSAFGVLTSKKSA